MVGLPQIVQRLQASLQNRGLAVPEEIWMCRNCRDSGWIAKHNDTGKYLGMAPCVCRLEAKVNSVLPPEYWGLSLQNFVARSDPQETIIQAMRGNPKGNYFLAGKQGKGKTLLCYMLVREALLSGRKVTVCDLPTLIEQHQKSATLDSAPAPICTAESIRADRTQLVFFDEFDKLNLTSFTYRKVFELMQAIYSYRVQLLAASNLTSGELESFLVSREENYGLSITRRLFESQGMQEFTL
jgi:hypothetical protein